MGKGENSALIALDRPLVLATRNQGKISEFKKLICDFGVEIKGLDDFGPIPPVVEDGGSFEENAVKKARFTARALGLPVLSDDSGLNVKALDGAPGIRSARYAGEDATDDANNERLLAAMEGIEDRSARFVCVLALAVPAGPALVYEGFCEGEIAYKQAGTQGFGYDPVFFHPGSEKTFAQMTGEEKNRISHRGQAMAELRSEFDRVLTWLRQRLAEEPS